MITYGTLDRATPESFEDMKALLTELHAGSSSTYEPSLENLERMVDSDRSMIVVARDGERIIGTATLYVLVQVDEISGYIDDVVVLQAYRGQGIATRLMEELIRVARDRNLKHLNLTSRPSREAANHLYQKLGFQKRETNPYRLKL